MIRRLIFAFIAGVICYTICTMVGNWVIAIQTQTGATVLASDVIEARYIVPGIISIGCAAIVYILMKDEKL